MVWRLIRDEIDWHDIGSQLLENLAKGNYSSEAVLREYVQNARDAYRTLDDPPDDPLITIRAFPTEKLLQITDLGVGMDLEGIRAAKKIAVSAKALQEEMAGFRGIGIWAGYEACDELVIKSTAKGDKNLYKLTIDFAAIRRAINTQGHIKEVIDPNYRIEAEEDVVDRHFTQVTLSGVYDPVLLKRDDLVRMASTDFPCRVDPSFEFGEVVRKALNGLPGYHEYTIKVCTPEGEIEALRSFPDDTVEPRFTTLKNSSGRELARAWWCATKAIQLKEERVPRVKRRGFRLRESNIAVGRVDVYSDKNGHQWGISKNGELPTTLKLDWFCGEIHITSPSVRPNTPRDALEQTDDSRELIDELRGFYRERMEEARGRSDFNSCRKTLELAHDFANAHDGTSIIDGTTTAQRRNDLIRSLREIPNKRKGANTNEKKRVLVQLLRGRSFETERKKVLMAIEAITLAQPDAVGSSSKGGAGNQSVGASASSGSGEGSGSGVGEVEAGASSILAAGFGLGSTSSDSSIVATDGYDGSVAVASHSRPDVEELVSRVIRVLEEVLGAGHEDFVPLAKRVEEVIGIWADVSD